MQVASLLEGLIERDKARELEWPVLEEICLSFCKHEPYTLDDLNRRFKVVICHAREPKLLRSQTWVLNSSRAFWD